MDSTRTGLLEKQPESPNNNTLKLYILSFIILLSLVFAGILFITAVINLRDSAANTIEIIHFAPTPRESVRAICSFTPYKGLCRNALSSHVSVNRSCDNYTHTLFLPEDIIFQSFQLGVDKLTRLTNISKFDDMSEFRECRVLLHEEISALNKSVASSQSLNSLRRQVNEYLDSFKRIETYQQGCLGKVKESGSVVLNDEFRLNLRKMIRYARNCRAVLLNIDPIIDEIQGSSSSSPLQGEHN